MDLDTQVRRFSCRVALNLPIETPRSYALVESRSNAYKSRASYVQARTLCPKTIHNNSTSFFNYISNNIASCQTVSRSLWSLAKVVSQNFCRSSFSPLENNSGSSSCTPSSKANLFASPTFPSNFNVDDQVSQHPFYPTSTITMSLNESSTRKVRNALLQLNTSKSRYPKKVSFY